MSKFPPWLKRRISQDSIIDRTKRVLEDLALHIVCQSARCPNIGECLSHSVVTFLILGNICTRKCGFCSIAHGKPKAVDQGEPARIAEAVERLGLKHVVITSVTRDDLADYGASHFANVVDEIKRRTSEATTEILTPDFNGSLEAALAVIGSRPDVFAHNVETVPRLYGKIRPQASYKRSLGILKTIKDIGNGIYAKSGLMVGMGETKSEVLDVMRDLREVGCDILTIGQYLKSSKENLDVYEFIHPEKFKEYEEKAYLIGFAYVASGPFVRSSYLAETQFLQIKNKRHG